MAPMFYQEEDLDLKHLCLAKEVRMHFKEKHQSNSRMHNFTNWDDIVEIKTH